MVDIVSQCFAYCPRGSNFRREVMPMGHHNCPSLRIAAIGKFNVAAWHISPPLEK